MPASAASPAALPAAKPVMPGMPRLSGVVYVALLNDPQAISALGDAAHQPTYKAPPQAPVLGLKPRNTLAADGAAIGVPADPGSVVLGVSLGIVLGRTACRVGLDQALAHVAGYLVAADLSLPLTSHYRPAARARARDGFCPMASTVVAASQVPTPDALAVRVWLDGALAHSGSTTGRVRGVAQLLADVTEFMTLQPGDVLMLGAAHGAPLGHAGQTVRLAIDGVGELGFALVAEPAPATHGVPA